ncbi:MAG: hypothetical protein ACE5K9_05120 [Candidatus Methylomirabilales bacterium]
MFQLSEAAAQVLKNIKDQIQEHQPGSVPRLVRSGDTDFNLGIDAPTQEDHELHSADETVLVVDQETSAALTNVTLDFQETPQGKAFVFKEREA